MRLRLPGIIASAEAEILVEPIGIDQLARIHLPIGIPKRLELAEGLHQFGPNILGKQFAAGLAISMFAGNRAAIAHDEVGGFFHKFAELPNAFGRFEIVVHAGVDAGMAKVPVKRAVVVMSLHQLAQVAEIGTKLVGTDGGVFEAFQRNGSPGTCAVTPRLDSRHPRYAWPGAGR